MRAFATCVAVIGATLLVAGTALAQPPRGGGMMMGMGGGAQLLNNKSVQDELKLTDDQKTKITEALQKVRQEQGEKMRELFQGGDQEKMRAAMREMAKTSDKAVKDLLKPEQYKRYKEISYQQSGLMAFADEDVQTALKFTAEQKDKIKALNEDFQKDMRELFQGGNFAEARPKLEALRKEMMTKAEATLTAEQKKAWEDLKGKAFEIKLEAPRRRPDR